VAGVVAAGEAVERAVAAEQVVKKEAAPAAIGSEIRASGEARSRSSGRAPW
jgi:hypothetical protein